MAGTDEPTESQNTGPLLDPWHLVWLPISAKYHSFQKVTCCTLHLTQNVDGSKRWKSKNEFLLFSTVIIKILKTDAVITSHLLWWCVACSFSILCVCLSLDASFCWVHFFSLLLCQEFVTCELPSNLDCSKECNEPSLSPSFLDSQENAGDILLS